MEDSKIKAKKIECILGILFLIPPILGVIAFVLCLFGCEWKFAELYNLSSDWTAHGGYSVGGGMSALMIIATDARAG